MCGILFVAERHGPVDERRFGAALVSIAHRGPDGSGAVRISLGEGPGDGMAALGHRRLSILDLSDRASQPFRRGGFAMTYNGEIYNFRGLRSALTAQFTTDGDTEVLFELLRERGVDGLADALGMWAFCFLDEARGRLIAGRDRLGKKPLFYWADERTICFASEIRAISTYRQQAPRLAARVVDAYLAHGWALPGAGEDTAVTGIRQVVPGGYVTVDLASWRLSSGTCIPADDWAPVDRVPRGDLAAAVRAAVTDRLVSDRRIGLLLSGGIDSSLILSVLCAERVQERVHCFIGEGGKSEDAAYAERVISSLGVKAEVIAIDYDNTTMDRFLDICRHQEKPFPLIGNVLGLPQLYERIAERDVPVVLDGTGADEVFGGYWERYYRFALAEAWDAGDTDWIGMMLAANADQPRIDEIGRTTLAALRAGSWPPSSVIGARPDTLMASQLATFCDAGVARIEPADPLVNARTSLARALRTDVTAALLPEWLWQNDRSAMRSGVENRSPFLDTRLAAYLGSGYRAKFAGAWNKHELRQLFDCFKPAPTQWRREKQGFRWAFGRFMRANRAKLLELIASSSMVRERVHAARLIDAIAHDDELLFSDLTQRCLVLAGLEASAGYRLGA